MKEKVYVIGVDSGTSSTRAILFDEHGESIAEGRYAYTILRPRPGWVEQKAEWWWEALIGALQKLFQINPVRKEQIAGISITHQRITFVPVDGSIHPLRNAILWNDIRCSKENEWANQQVGREKIYKRTGYNPGIWSVYKAMWLRNHEPEIYDKTYKFLLVQDYLTYKLTGEIATTSSAAVMTGCLDIADRHQWAEDILEDLRISPTKWVETIVSGGEIIGRVSPEAAQETGLPEGLPVISTAGDQPCGVVGAGVIEPAILGINGGTSCTMETCTENLILDTDGNYFVEISPMGTYFPENSVYSGGSALMNWLKQLIASDNIDESGWNAFYDLAKESPFGNWGLMLIPYFSGATAPYWDLEARGVMFGFLMDHSKGHLVRAVMEGLAYEVRRQAGYIEKGTRIQTKEIRMYGGSARSDLWNQTFANIMGIPVSVPKTVETTALGAAICAAKGVGIYPSIEEAARIMVHISKNYVPDKQTVPFYDRLFNEVYLKFYDRIQDLIRCATAITREIS